MLIGIVCIFLIHNLNGIYGDEECPAEVIDNLNKKIDDALSTHPEKAAGSLTISGIYYDRYENLKKAKLSEHAKQTDCDNAKKTLETFLEIASELEQVFDRMEKAVEVLTKLEYDKTASTELKYNALSVRTAIKHSASAKEAEAALERYEKFKKDNNISM